MVNEYNKVSIGVSLHSLLFCLLMSLYFFLLNFKKVAKRDFKLLQDLFGSIFVYARGMVLIQSDNTFMTYVIVSLAVIMKNHIQAA